MVVQSLVVEVSETQKLLDQWVSDYRPLSKKGQCASYIPALTKHDPSSLGISIMGRDGTLVKSGNWNTPFTLQSISKIISFMAVCISRGVEYVLQRVDVEPTGDPYNSIIRLESNKPGKPFNPMINAGAITVASLLPGDSADAKFAHSKQLLKEILGKVPKVDNAVYESEWKTTDRNRALAYYLKATGYLEADVDTTLKTYLLHCSIALNTEDLAKIGVILACNGFDPFRNVQVIPREIATLTKALMLTCGMYNASGKFAAFVGIPAKSGVSGGILAAGSAKCEEEHTNHTKHPFHNGCGIGIYGPAIDDIGNSVAGAELLKRVSEHWNLSVFV